MVSERKGDNQSETKNKIVSCTGAVFAHQDIFLFTTIMKVSNSMALKQKLGLDS